MKLRLAGTVNRLNVEHRTSNIDVHFFVDRSYETTLSFFYDQTGRFGGHRRR
jgi:hypothetical protein